MTKVKPEEPKDGKPEEPKDGKPAAEPKGDPAAGGQAPGALDQLLATIDGMNQRMGDMEQAISALANQGAVNASVNGDNGNGEDDYPTIDLDKLMGV